MFTKVFKNISAFTEIAVDYEDMPIDIRLMQDETNGEYLPCLIIDRQTTETYVSYGSITIRGHLIITKWQSYEIDDERDNFVHSKNVIVMIS